MSISSLTHQTVRGAGADAVAALWNLLASPTIDPATLARAIETVLILRNLNLDWRTLQLVKEGWEALEQSIEQPLLNEYLFERTAMQITEAIRSLTADVSKSHRDVKFKDLDDFRLLSLNLNKEVLRQRVLQGSSSLIASDHNGRQAIKNWYIVYGDDLGLVGA